MSTRETHEAPARLRAVGRLSAAGQRAGRGRAARSRALAFCRGVGGTAAIREGETLLAAAS
jgi:hypothetical protein